MTNWHTLPLAQIEAELRTDFRTGLAPEEARRRTLISGRNELPRGKSDPIAFIFLRQFQSPLIYVLFAAAVMVYWMGEQLDATLICAVLLFNAVVGTVQEGKAQNTLAALRRFTQTATTVLRDGKEIVVPEVQIVPGDIIVLHEGEKVPADARIVEVNNLAVNEAALTGESVPTRKQEAELSDEGASLPEQSNMAFQGTIITSGLGKAVVVATGAQSVIGRISQAVASMDTEIPLKKDIRLLSRMIIAACIGISAVIFLFGVAVGRSVEEMFATTVSLAVSIIPEGLPVVLTLILASGVWRMARRQALVKRLQAVEALGQARVIAVDKTGTLTKNEMVVREILADGKTFQIGGDGYEPKGEVNLEGKPVEPPGHPELLLAAKIASFCAGARVVFWPEENIWKVSGDPTEAALLVFAQKMGFNREGLEGEMPLLAETPFDYRTKIHASLHRAEEGQFLAVTGAPEVVLHLSSRQMKGGKAVPLSSKERNDLSQEFNRMSREGRRVVAFAYREGKEVSDPKELVFAGFYGIEDSLRPEVPEAMRQARAAGVRVVMITGDSRLTAIAIAKEAGIWHEGDTALTDEEVEGLGEGALSEQLATTTVFARITPEHKMKIIQAYKRRGEVVAMTGDGVNDAPSLVAADLGVAMGKIGTEVAKEAADIVLLDDNFGSIVSAIEEGRNMYAAIQKTILFLFSTSIGEVLIIASALFLGYPLPLTAPQILWLNLITDSFVALALAMDHKEKNLLAGDFQKSKRYLVNGLMVWRMILMAIPMAIGTIWLFAYAYPDDIVKGWTVALTAAAVFQWLNGWNCRSDRESVFRTNPFANGWLVAGVGMAAVMQFVALHTPIFQRVLHIVPLNLAEWGWIILVCSSIILVEEVRKFFYRRKLARTQNYVTPAALLLGH